MNIQSNALKFTESNGTVTIYYTLYKQNGKSFVEIQVKDTGLGIKRVDKSKLFKLFGFVQSTQEVNTRGIGLGLVISKKITEKFNGSIGFRSKWQKGSTFAYRMELEKDLVDTEVQTQLDKTIRMNAAQNDSWGDMQNMNSQY